MVDRYTQVCFRLAGFVRTSELKSLHNMEAGIWERRSLAMRQKNLLCVTEVWLYGISLT